MVINKEVPFYANTPDNTHCFQAALRMVLKYFYPAEEYSWEELDRITAKAEGMWTWPMVGLLWAEKKGMEVVDIELFDYAEFARRGGDYLVETVGEEIARISLEHTGDLDQTRREAQEFAARSLAERRIPDREEIKELVRAGYLVICLVNGSSLQGEEGYSGHFIVIKGFDDKGFFAHDPGLPAEENMHIEYPAFEKAWAYPDEGAKNIMALKKKEA